MLGMCTPGISTMVDILLQGIPDAPPPRNAARVLSRLQPQLVALSRLLRVSSATVAHGFLGRCGDVLWVRAAF